MKRTIALTLLAALSLGAQEAVTLRPISHGKVFGGPLRLALETELAEAGGRFALVNDRADYTAFITVRIVTEDAQPVELMTFDAESPARIADEIRVGMGFSSLSVSVGLRHRTCRSGPDPDDRIEFEIWRSKFDEVAMHRIARGISKRLNQRSKLLRSSRLACPEAQ